MKDIKAVKSKINQLEARLDTIRNSGHFSEEEIKNLSPPITKQLENLKNND